MRDNRAFVLVVGLLLTFMVGATQVQSYVNGIEHIKGGGAIHTFKMDRFYLRKFTGNLISYWMNTKYNPSDDEEGWV
jgi:hypothetical protein